MAKIGYRFNPDTLSYDKIEIPLRKKIGRLLRKFFSSLSLAVVIFFIVSAVIDSPKEKALRREKQEILAQYHLLNNEVSRLDAVLKTWKNGTITSIGLFSRPNPSTTPSAEPAPVA